MNKSILITGGCGFIGSHFVDLAVNKLSEYEIVVVDALYKGSNINNIVGHIDNNVIKFFKEDIINKEFLKELFSSHNFEKIFHFAAESHVDRSIVSPRDFIISNILGTFELLSASHDYWSSKNIENHLFFHVSTDEVYGDLDKSDPSFTEESNIKPNSPYSASKASSDLLVRAYAKTFNLKTIITNCSNNFGPRQDTEKLIPKAIEKILDSKKVPIYGKGDNIRDWLYVNDHVNSIYQISKHPNLFGKRINIGGNNEINNLQILETIIDSIKILYKESPRLFQKFPNFTNPTMKDLKDFYVFVEDRKGHDFRYSIDNTLIKNSINDYLLTDFNEAILNTIRWYLNHFNRSV